MKIQECSFWLCKGTVLIKEKSHALIIALELSHKCNKFPKYNHYTFLEKITANVDLAYQRSFPIANNLTELLRNVPLQISFISLRR